METILPKKLHIDLNNTDTRTNTKLVREHGNGRVVMPLMETVLPKKLHIDLNNTDTRTNTKLVREHGKWKGGLATDGNRFTKEATHISQ